MSHPAVPDIASLRSTCHGGKVSKDRRPWYVLQRRVSIYLTWLLLHTGLRPNHVTALSVGFTLLGAARLSMRAPGLAIAGGIAFLTHHLLDKVDGDIARFQKRHSIVGVYLDDLGHSLAFAGIFLGLGLHLAWRTPEGGALVLVLTAGALGALAMVLGRQQKSVGFLLYAQYVMVQPELLPSSRGASPASALTRGAVHRSRKRGSGPEGPVGILPRLRDAALQLSDFSLMMVLLIAGAVVEAVTGNDAFLRALLFGGAALQGVVLAALVAVNATVNVESEVARLHESAGGLDAEDRP
jgi:phosphatidylglycerophosphate synthase